MYSDIGAAKIYSATVSTQKPLLFAGNKPAKGAWETHDAAPLCPENTRGAKRLSDTTLC